MTGDVTGADPGSAETASDAKPRHAAPGRQRRPRLLVATAMIAAGLVATAVGVEMARSDRNPSPPSTTLGTILQPDDSPVVTVGQPPATTASTPSGANTSIDSSTAPNQRAVAVAMTQAQNRVAQLALSSLRVGPSPHLASTTDGRLLISDAASRRVFAVSTDDTGVEVIAGDGTDGTSPAAILQNPGPITVDSFGGIAIADQPQGDRPGRIVRLDPSGQASVLAQLATPAFHLYADDLGSVIALTGSALLRVGAAGDIATAELPTGADQLIPVTGGRWLAVSLQAGTLSPISLFNSSTDGLAPVDFTSNSDANIVAVSAVGGPKFARLECTTNCTLIVFDDSGTTLASGPADRVSSIVSRSGGIALATVDGRVLMIDDPLIPATSRDLIGTGEVFTADATLAPPASGHHLDPTALAVGPDGAVYWIDNYPARIIGVLAPDGHTDRLVIPAEIRNPQGLLATKQGLVVFADRVHMLSYESLQVDKLDQRNRAAEAPVSTDLFAARARGLLAFGFDAQTLSATDSAGFTAFVDGTRLMGFGPGDRQAVELARASTNEADSPAAFGLPEDQIGTIGGIAAVDRGWFVVTDPSSDRLTQVRLTNGVWTVSRFRGTQPQTVVASPLSQRTPRPRAITAGADGSVSFVTDGGTINRMSPGGAVRVIAGGAAATSTAFGRIGGVAIAVPDNATSKDRVIVVSDTMRHRVVRVNRDGSTTIIMGRGVAGTELTDLDSPTALAAGRGLIVVADSANHRVMSVDESGNIARIAGTGESGAGPAVGAAADMSLNNPTGVAIAADGRIAISDTDNNRVLLVGLDGQVSPVASVDHPTGLAFLDDDHLAISASTDGQIYRVQLSTKKRSVIAGLGVRGYQGDGGLATAARLQDPNGIAVGPDGSVYVADAGNGAIRRVTADGRIDTLVGDRSFTNPTGIAIDPLLGMVFGEADGRLFSVSTASLDTSAPGWFKPQN